VPTIITDFGEDIGTSDKESISNQTFIIGEDPVSGDSTSVVEPKISLIDDKYRLLEPIASGGMGTVYRAEQISLKREVAIKMIRSPDRDGAVQRFLQEASITAQFKHPNTVRIYDFGHSKTAGMYLVMELIDGLPLQEYVSQKGALRSDQVLLIAKQLCGALSEAHRKKIVHRDIKPSNILLVEEPDSGLQAKLIDFGVGKDLETSSELSHDGMIVGSPMYMSPEQVTCSVVDDRSDLYSLGLSLYFALSGQKPYKVRDIHAVLHAQVYEKPDSLYDVLPPPKFSAGLVAVIQKAVEKSTERRFESAVQMLVALNNTDVTMDETMDAFYSSDQLSSYVVDEADKEKLLMEVDKILDSPMEQIEPENTIEGEREEESATQLDEGIKTSEAEVEEPIPHTLEITMPPSMQRDGMVRDLPIQKPAMDKKNLANISTFDEQPINQAGGSSFKFWGFIILIVLFWFYISMQ
jgi:serine/threonine protein kinase